MTWNSRNKRHYVDLGYEFTQMGDTFHVDINDLTVGSQAVVKLRCDYCGRIYDVPWYRYMKTKRSETLHVDACAMCCECKANDTIVAKYGNHSQLFYSCNTQRINTNLDRYGCINVFSSDEVKEKIVQTNLKKYGVPYSQQNGEVRSKTVSTCREKYGVDHYVELFKGKYRGENSPSWKGGIACLTNPRATPEYISWRKLVFSRDMYTCKRCGAHSGGGKSIRLNAHHIYNWSDHPELRYDTDNGITLCEKCHNEFHSIYGKRNNNQDQLTSFLQLDEKVC